MLTESGQQLLTIICKNILCKNINIKMFNINKCVEFLV